ncbi:uncharacterized protein LOC142564372 isoform X2 [Dermacentor variabilis]
MIQQEDPVVLLWGERPPSSLGTRICWMSKFESSAPGGGVQVTVHRNWAEKADSQDARRKINQVDAVVTFSISKGHTILKVETTANTEFTASFKGEYEILHASGDCFIIRGPRSGSGSGLCTVWVKKASASQPHTECRSAFKEQCQGPSSCSPTKQS